MVHQQERLADERKAWEQEIVVIKDKNKFNSDTISLDVGGKRMTISIGTL